MNVLDVNATIESTTKILRLLGGAIELRTALSPQVGGISADQIQIEQVILNLAMNARDAMPKGGTLTIESANIAIDGAHGGAALGIDAGYYVMLVVTDTGAGLDDTIQNHIFTPSSKERGKGASFRLGTVFGIVKQCNGFMWVRSEPAAGTSFKILFPRVKPLCVVLHR